jgi:putative nucleotide binding protein
VKEEYVIALDYLPNGYASSFKKEPVVQAVGELYFSLLELVAKPGAKIAVRERVYVGPEKREKVQFIKGRLEFSRLTACARNELRQIVEEMVQKREPEFVNFFNNAQPITPRMHTLELIPGIGKKYMWDILNSREKKPYESFEDLQSRVSIPNPAKLIVKRVIEELSSDTKYRLFTRSS